MKTDESEYDELWRQQRPDGGAYLVAWIVGALALACCAVIFLYVRGLIS